MRLLISAGGTGGGIYPALAVANALQAADKSAEFLWIGSHGGIEENLVPRAGLPLRLIHGGGLHGVGWKMPLNAFNLVRGCWEALEQLKAFRPDAVLVTGGFVAVPTALAAWLQRVPVMLYLPDIEPALAAKFVARLARVITVTTADAQKYFGFHKRVIVTGYPVRAELLEKPHLPHVVFGLDAQRPTVLVTGGSRGARSLNRAVFAALPQWLPDFQVIHLTGQLDWSEAEQVKAALPAELKASYFAAPYWHEMGQALAAANLVVSRAGASALGEYPLFGLPSVLVPYPYAWRYQKVNADYLVQRGAAIRLNDEMLGAQLANTVRDLLKDKVRLQAMAHAAHQAAQPQAAQNIVAELLKLVS